MKQSNFYQPPTLTVLLLDNTDLLTANSGVVTFSDPWVAPTGEDVGVF